MNVSPMCMFYCDECGSRHDACVVTMPVRWNRTPAEDLCEEARWHMVQPGDLYISSHIHTCDMHNMVGRIIDDDIRALERWR